MSTELIVNASLPETRIALMEGGEIQEILIERATGKGIVGNIYKGRVTRVLPGMQAAFVDIGLEKAAFLYVDDVYVHSDIWAEEEGEAAGHEEVSTANAGEGEVAAIEASAAAPAEGAEGEAHAATTDETNEEGIDEDSLIDETEEALAQHPELLSEEEAEEQMAENLAAFDEEEEDGDDDNGPVGMGAEGGDDDENGGNQTPAGTISENESENDGGGDEGDFEEGSEAAGDAGDAQVSAEGAAPGAPGALGEGRKRRRGRRGGRNRKRGRDGRDDRGPRGPNPAGQQAGGSGQDEAYPDSYREQVSEQGDVQSDRASFAGEPGMGIPAQEGDGESNRPAAAASNDSRIASGESQPQGKGRPEFREPRSRDRRIKPKSSSRPVRGSVNIQDLLKEGQEVIVQVAKDPIATKGARLTCHISLPGRHLVCMPTIDHVGVSRRIERDDERRKLRDFVERNRPKKLGFIVRTATAAGKQQSETRIKQDIDYLTALWDEIRDKANNVQAPALVYEDLNPVLRAIRDWVNEDIDKIVVDSRYHYNDVVRFVSHFMPQIKHKVELYNGDIPIFDAYSISTELARALERKVWLKSGGYIVVDQAEALVAIDVNTGRYVGKKSLEDTILKTNLEAVKEIAYQLRLRNCGGIIILDLIDMEKEENKFRVYRALEEELKKDRARPQILKISELGLVEMTRKRTRDTMVRALCESCPHCEGKSFIKSKQTVAYEILRDIEREGIDRDVNKILVKAHPDVIDQLAIDERESLDQLERRYRKSIYLQAVNDHHSEQFDILTEKRTNSSRTDDEIWSRARGSAGVESRNDRGRRRERGRKGGRDRNEGGRNQNEGGDRERESSDRQAGGGDRESRRERNRDRNRDRNRGGRDRNQNQNQGGRGDGDRKQFQIRTGGPAASGEGVEPGNAAPRDQQGVSPVVDDDRQPDFGSSGEHPSAFASSYGAQNAGGSTQPPRSHDDEEGMTEEDRLAFLRAQAAQDAALAGGGANGNRGNNQNRQSQNRGGRGGQGGGQGGGGRDRNGGRGGRDRNRGGRGGQGGGQGGGGRDRNGGRGGRFQGGFRNDRGGAPANETVSTAPRNDGGGNQGGGDDSGGGNGGGDHSNPPT